MSELRGSGGSCGPLPGIADEEPFRTELFGVDQLVQHAWAIAERHTLAAKPGPDRLLQRLKENKTVLLRAYCLVTDAAEAGHRTTPAADWMLDNFYLIEEQIRTARLHLPKEYSRALPRLLTGPTSGFPRVYDIALELISHADGSVTGETLGGFIAAYQTGSVLKLGELWAIPIMLRLALIENLRRVAARLISDTLDRNRAYFWADQLIEAAEENPSNFVLSLADMARADIPMTGAFVGEITRRLQGRSPSLGFALTWIEQWLSECGGTIAQSVEGDTRKQAADQVSICNSIGSLRLIASMDWRQFVESMSLVEQTLRTDPAGIYDQMDFATRDQYRHVVERIARGSRLSEAEVADRAIALAAANGPSGRTAHVGCHLIDSGLSRLETTVNFRISLKERAARVVRRFPLFFYLAPIFAITAIVSWRLLAYAYGIGVGLPLLAVIAILPLLGASHLAVSLVNWIAMMAIEPRTLPKLDFIEGIPPAHRTLVAVPAMLGSASGVDDLIEGLHVRFLANRDANLRFALLTDLPDAAAEMLPGDAALLDRARRGIEDLNARYDTGAGGYFLLLHRPRRWNAVEKVWMGWERKRGKLADLNALLRGRGADRFSLLVGDASALPAVRYVITLDTDTQLPRDAARRLIGTMAHPLNQPVFDPVRRVVVQGYGILQPRVDVSLPSTGKSRYARFFAGEAGIDPYTRTVSDIYQDLFREGSFIGKGIYDVDAFERALCGRFPENRILSHDLLEGCHARSGLVSDVELIEDFPSFHSADISRRHRWIRGDWQIAPWLLPFAPTARGGLQSNPISLLSRWKLADNLRRSLIPPALTLLLLLGWTVLDSGVFWSLCVAGMIIVPLALESLVEFVRKPADISSGAHLRSTGRSLARRFAQGAFTLAFLPFDAFCSLDAIIRTCGRMLFTHRLLLDWRTARDAEIGGRIDLGGHFRAMWIAPFIAGAALAGALFDGFNSVAPAAPFLALWFMSPAISWWLSLPLAVRAPKLDAARTLFLGRLARKTWGYFEAFVGAQDHWLPPDNYQEYPVEAVAHRTSPTNIGIYLLSNLAAHDFGYLSGGGLMQRIGDTLATMKRLERHRGHFFNWYDTQTLAPLQPMYVSTVDSGNLAGFLITLRAGLAELPDQPILHERVFTGLEETHLALSDAARKMSGQSNSKAITDGQVDLLRRIRELGSDLALPPGTLVETGARLLSLAASSEEFAAGLVDLPDENVRRWARAFASACRSHLDELALLAPWSFLPPPPVGLWDRAPSEASTGLRTALDRLETIPTLRVVVRLGLALGLLCDRILAYPPDGVVGPSPADLDWFTRLCESFDDASGAASARMTRLGLLATDCMDLANCDYTFLYDKSRRLMAIGYNVAERRRDASFYDLLASEARLATFIAIAQDQLPQDSWFALGRLLTSMRGRPTLLSWSGSMFEYLMPLLIMPTFENTLLDETCKAAVERQMRYGAKRGVPWGISESGYNLTDANLLYQYRAFGVPGLGLKRGLADDLVVAPYASAMALMVSPEAACRNLQALADLGLEGRHGFYEAVDYTPARLAPREKMSVVQSFMAHHQGMSLLSFAYHLLGKPMQRRFESDPMFQATGLLLQERVPKYAPVVPRAVEVFGANRVELEPGGALRVYSNPDTPVPEVHLLSNGRYSVMITNSGGGYSRWRDIAITRWREDATRDNWGMFCYIRDLGSGDFWSTSHQPTLRPARNSEAVFPLARAEFKRRHREIETHAEVVVSPEDEVEIRRVTVTNRSRAARALELTSYAEVALTTPAADASHPAFSNLFVETEILRERRAIICTRRPRAADEHPMWMFHLICVHGPIAGDPSYETDRLKFIGRGRTSVDPLAMNRKGDLSGGEGCVLDPIVAIRERLTIDPEAAAVFDIVTGVAETREGILALIEKYHDHVMTDRAFGLAATHAQVVLRQIGASEADAQVYERLASSIVYASPLRRADPGVLMRNPRGQSGLWGYGISGDLPIVILRFSDKANIELLQQMVRAHAYWRLKGLAVDLVILDEDRSGYRQALHDLIMGLIASGSEAALIDRPGGIFVRSNDQIPEDDRILLETVARAIIVDTAGTLAEQIERQGREGVPVPPLVPAERRTLPEAPRRLFPMRPPDRPAPAPNAGAVPSDLILFNGFGGFTPDGREYIIRLPPGVTTPMPWVNVLANATFGTVVSECGGSYTWSENAREFRLTPWYNDPVSDPSGEAFYIRDEETGRFWSPTALPARGAMPYVTRHGFGYTVFEYTDGGIATELWIYLAHDAPVKFARLKVRNASGRVRRLSATGFIEWVLGEHRHQSSMHVVTEIDPRTGALFARNSYNTEFSSRVSFFDINEPGHTLTGDRTEFIGRNGGPASPAAMTRARLSGKVGAGLDPCAALQTQFDLADGQEREIVFTLGTGRNAEEARGLVQRFRGINPARQALEGVWEFWKRSLGAVHVESPDVGLNVLANGWLLYQAWASRLCGRSGYYQSGGAYGFRDQLQDSLALVHSAPWIIREHVLRCAGRQFPEGDVQHWWHPPSGRGVRTQFSDDFLWLPWVTAQYIDALGDTGVLDERIGFIEGRALRPDEDSNYDLPSIPGESATLYDHCVRAILHGLRYGAHGLPLMGGGDWNDGMNLVGGKGTGESVWLAFFLYDVLVRFGKIAAARGDSAFVDRCKAEAAGLREAVEANAWDGEWYRRAYFDDGQPLGSAENSECQIDSLPQSWAILSGGGNPARARTAMESVEKRLVRRDAQLIEIFDPPFNNSDLNPGYIKGYPPGVRENGGQYTHAAIWTAMAFGAMGDTARLWECFQILNPLNHASTPEKAATYMVEPYVIAADVYSAPPHTGRGGWTWYTGSAAWMYRLVTETILGLRLNADRLTFVPRAPSDWETYVLHYRYRETFYHIRFTQRAPGANIARVTVDGADQPDKTIHLLNDRREHEAVVEIG